VLLTGPTLTKALAALALIALVCVTTAAAAAPKPWTPIRTEKHAGTVDAVLSGQRRVSHFGPLGYRRLTLVIRNAGKKVYDRPICTSYRCGLGSRHSLSLEAVWKGATPDVIVDFFTGGAHCCFESLIVLVNGTSPPRSIFHDWGDPGYEVQRFNGTAEFLTEDDRFAYEFTSFAASGLPAQVWTIEADGHLVDVTGSRPDLIRKDAAQWWEAYVSYRYQKDSDVRGLLAAWCADQYRLGHAQKCTAELERAQRHGFLRGPDVWPQNAKFIAALEKTLARWGYRPA
jgi:hypothetical protein